MRLSNGPDIKKGIITSYYAQKVFLLSQIESGNDLAVTIDVEFFKIVKKTSSRTDHL